VVPSSDSIESLAHDHVHNRLAVTTHYGEVRLYTVEKSGKCHHKKWQSPLMMVGSLVELWQKRISDAIPRAIHFIDNYQTIVYFALESAEM
jgi:hypothetical protein